MRAFGPWKRQWVYPWIFAELLTSGFRQTHGYIHKKEQLYREYQAATTKSKGRKKFE
jgi:hypothetical protein